MTGRIGKYKVEKELGAGGFGKVYLAFDPDIGQQVAIKKLRAAGDPDLLKRFQLEIRTTASLRHKNIVTIHASGEDDGDPYLVMEFLEGATLKQVIQERRPLSLLEKVRIMGQVAEGLAFAHSKGVVHRDVKPENIMLMPDDNVKIMDFGIALGPERHTNVTQTGGIIGTPPYFAPEQLEGSKANEQTDIFSYGDVYYELLTGAHPFEQHKGEWRSLQMAILSYEPRPVGELLPGCPESLETLVHRTLAKQPEFRYQKFEELQLDSEAIMVDLKHETAAAILREIPSLMDAGYLQSALSKIRQAYQLEPGNREVRRLREEINFRIQGDQRQKQIAELLANADKQMTEGRYAEAVQSLELGYRLDSNNVVVAGRLEEAKAKRDNYVQANRLLSEARFKQQKGFLTEAHEKVQEALSVDPENTDAQRLSQRIGDELKRRQLEQKLLEGLRTARALRKERQFADALATLDEVDREVPGAAPVAELRADIQNELAEENRRVRAERFNLAISKTREVMDAGDLDRARQMLDHLSANFASEPGAGEMLPALRERLNSLTRAQAIAHYQQNARSLLKEKAFREALDLLAEARNQFPDDPGLERLTKIADDLFVAQQRSEAITAILRDATTKRAAGDLQSALDAIVDARQKLGEEAALTDLARLLEMEIAQQRYSTQLDSLLKSSRALLSAAKYSEVIDQLVAAKEFSGEAEVRSLLESARAEAAIENERRFVEDTLASAGKLQAEESWTRALSAVELGLAQYPQNAKLTRTAERLRERVERERQRTLIEGHRGAIRREIEAARWTRARSALDKARAEFPGEEAFDDLSDQIEAGLYEQGWRDLETRVQQSLAANNVSQAEQNLESQATRTLYQQDPRWKPLAEQVAKRRGYEDALAEAERRRKGGALSEAEALLTHVISQGTPDMRAVQMRGAIQSQRSETLRQQEIARIAQGIRDCLKQNNVSQADAELTAARSRYPGETSWSELQAQCDAIQQASRRKAEIAKAMESVQSALSRDEIPRALSSLQDARTRFSDEPGWADLEQQIKKRQAVLQRQTEISALAESIRACLVRDHLDVVPRAGNVADPAALVTSKRRDDLRKSKTELHTARKKYPGESLWPALESEIEARRVFLDAESRIAGQVAQQLERGDIAQAEVQLAAANRDYPDPGFWNLVAGGVEQRREFERQRADVARIAERVRERLNADALRDAASELNSARTRYPGEPVWQELQTKLDARQAQFDRAAEIAEIARRLRAGLDDQLQRKLLPAKIPFDGYPIAPVWDVLRSTRSLLGQAEAKYPGEAVWETLQIDISGLEARFSREVTEVVRACQSLVGLEANARQLAAARSSFPGEPLWAMLEVEIQARRKALEEASIAQHKNRVQESLLAGDLRAARSRLDDARTQHPGALPWAALQAEIDSRQAELSKREELEVAERSVREHLDRVKRIASEPQGSNLIVRQWEAFRSALDTLEPVHARYPGEKRLAVLKTEIASQRQRWEGEIAQAITEIIRNRPAKGFSARPVVSEVSVLEAREPANLLWSRLQAEIDAAEALLARQAEISAAGERVRASLQRDDIRQATSDLQNARAKFHQEALWTTLQSEIDACVARQQQRLREIRDQARAQILAIEGQLAAGVPVRQAKKLDRQAQELAAGYLEDPEIVAIAARIHRQAETSIAAPASRPVPWKPIAIGGGGVLAAAALSMFFFHGKSPEPVKPPAVALVPVEIRTDPPGAAVRVGDHSCTTPNCRLELAQGSYQVEAQLNNYEPKQQTIRVDASNRLVELTLNPVAPPEPQHTAANGTLIVQTGVPEALVYVDNIPQRNRTDQSGAASLVLEAKAHEVRVERNNYEKPAAKQVNLVAGGQQTLVFRLIPENARIELSGAILNLEVRVDGSSIGRTDGSARFVFSAPIRPGDRMLEVSQGRLQTGQGTAGRSLTQRFQPGQTVSLIWKPDAAPASSSPAVSPAITSGGPAPSPGPVTTPVVPPNNPPPAVAKAPTPEELEERDWEKVRDASDPAQLQNFRRKYPNGRHARDADNALERITWATVRKDSPESLRTYVQEFPNGAHATEANSQIGELLWKNVDPNNLEQLRKFAEENPGSPHAREAQRKLDQVNATQDVFRRQVVDTLAKLNIEFNRKPVKEAKVKETWPGVTRMFLDSLKQPGQEITLTPIEDAKVQGEVATVRCNLTAAQGRVKSQMATVVFHYGGGRWVISDLKVGQ